MAIPDISAEIAAFRSAAYGEDVRGALIQLAQKLSSVVTEDVTIVSGYNDRLLAVEADDWVTTNRILNEAVTTAKLDNEAVTTDKIADEAVTTDKIDDGAVTTDKIDDGAITDSKLAQNNGVLDKISNLESDLNALANAEKTITNIETTSGKVIRINTGAEYSGAPNGWADTDYIKIPYGTYKIKTNINNGLNISLYYGYAIYDENKQYLTSGQNLDIEILQTYKYIRMSNYNEDNDHSGLYIKFIIGKAFNEIELINGEIESINGEIESINGEIESINGEIESINDNIDDANNEISNLESDLNALANAEKTITNIETTSGKVIRIDTGAENSGAPNGWVDTDYIEIPYGTYKIKTNINNGLNISLYYGYAIYDENKQYLTGGQNLDIEILQTYKYIRMSNYNADNDHSGLYIKFIIGKVFNEIELINGEIESINNNLGEYSLVSHMTSTTASEGTLINFSISNMTSANQYKIIIDSDEHEELQSIVVYAMNNTSDAVKIDTWTNLSKPLIFNGIDGKHFIKLYGRGLSSDVATIDASLYVINDIENTFYYRVEKSYEKVENFIEINDVLLKLGSETNNIYILGDSIVAGVGGSNFNGSSTGSTPVEQTSGELIMFTEYRGTFYRNTTGVCWANMMKTFLESKFQNTTVYNNGCSGINSNTIASNLSQLLPVDATIAIICIGINDRGGTPDYDTFKTNIQRIVHQLRQREIPFIFLTPINASLANDTDPNKNFNSYMVARGIKEVASDSFEAADLQSEFSYYLYSHELTLDDVLGDGLHPNDLGYTIMFNIIKRLLNL